MQVVELCYAGTLNGTIHTIEF